jgi:hypothetical protein
VSCSEAGVCERGSDDDVGLPDFITVDVPGKRLGGHGSGGRSSPIANSQKLEGMLVVEGVEKRAWSAIVTPQGRISSSAAEDGGGFLFFGVCTDR